MSCRVNASGLGDGPPPAPRCAQRHLPLMGRRKSGRQARWFCPPSGWSPRRSEGEGGMSLRVNAWCPRGEVLHSGCVVEHGLLMPRTPRRDWSKELSRRLRAAMTPEEARLWNRLRHDLPWKFRRQEPIDRFICDFVCYPKRLVVEVDGLQHVDDPEDVIRDGRLAELGFMVVRVSNTDVVHRLSEVVDRIGAALESRPDLQANRAPRGR